MRVLMLVHDFLPASCAGVEIHTLRLAQALRDAGTDVQVMVPHESESLSDLNFGTELVAGVPVHRVFSGHLRVDTFQTDQPAVSQVLLSLIDRVAPDVVHIQHTLRWTPGFCSTVAMRWPTFLTLHDHYFLCGRIHMLDSQNRLCTGPETPQKCASCVTGQDYSGPLAEDQKRIIATVAQRLRAFQSLIGLCRTVTAPTAYLKNRFVAAGFPEQAIRVQPLGTPSLPRRATRTSPLVFGFVGTIHPNKNFMLAIESFLKAGVPGARMVIWGGGLPTFVNMVQQVCQQYPGLEYRGSFSSSDTAVMEQIFAGIDVLVHPSAVENYPTVIRESLVSGVFVVASDAGGIREIGEMDTCGQILDTADADVWAQALLNAAGRCRLNNADGNKTLLTYSEEAALWQREYTLHTGKGTTP